MPSWAGLPLRGTTVIVVMVGLLAATGFFNQAELKALNDLRRIRSVRRTTAAPPDTTEVAGEIVAVDLPDEGMPVPDKKAR
jgi:hypothetical protein